MSSRVIYRSRIPNILSPGIQPRSLSHAFLDVPGRYAFMTKVALLWHMHQPFYQDLVTGEHILPWVRLHGLKDYYGMVALLREFPDVKLTFTLVPSLLVQLEAFAAEPGARPHAGAEPQAGRQLTDEDKRFILAHFFHAQRARMIEPYPRYAELLRRARAGRRKRRRGQGAFRGRLSRPAGVAQAGLGRPVLDGHATRASKGLLAQGRGFSEDDKLVLREVELEILGSVVPEYAAAAARGQIEIAASPFYHPILPLVCDTDIYLRTHPHSRMPRQRFRHPEDALAQLERAAVVSRAAVRPAARRAVALGGIGVRRDHPAGRAGRLHVDRDRRGDPRAHAEHRA